MRRFDDYLPYSGLENVYEREGMRLGRSTLYGRLDKPRELFAPLVKAMLDDARTAPYLCTDATSALGQAAERCTRGHFWVLVVYGRHVIFALSDCHDSAAVDKLRHPLFGHLRNASSRYRGSPRDCCDARSQLKAAMAAFADAVQQL